MNEADTKEVGRLFFQLKKEVKENDLPDMLPQMYNHEFTEYQYLHKDVADTSHKDLKIIEILKHYQVQISFRKDEVN